jgi:hypothetical protein
MEANGFAFDLEGGSETTPPCCGIPMALKNQKHERFHYTPSHRS